MIKTWGLSAEVARATDNFEAVIIDVARAADAEAIQGDGHPDALYKVAENG